jgi:hypothetical protein
LPSFFCFVHTTPISLPYLLSCLPFLFCIHVGGNHVRLRAPPQQTPRQALLFFANYTIHRRHSQRTHTHPYEYTHANPTPRSIFEDCAGKSSRLTKSPQAPRCRRERRLPLKAQTPLNPEKFAPTGSRTQDLRCYRGSCNH